ncbi:farnesyl pyrophosphate synthase isoform X2 [Vespula squamosa]|uniref:Farnesyl pyrophosphate synthase n=1 Tax=Vespula squamosa TaxID=30214 RepID=A0ABD2AD77_VESSQ
MSLSVIGKRLFAFCGNGFYHKHTKFAALNKIRLLRTRNTEIRMAAHIMTQTTRATNKDETREVMALWPDLVRDLMNIDYYSDIPDVSKWIVKILQYNVPNGRKRRALALIYAYRMLAPPEQLTDENIRLARILGWCIEMIQAFLLIIDDIQDKSQMRRNQPCWYLCNDIGLAAINDAIMLESAMYQLLRIYFKEKECYVDIMELFHEITMKTTMGQCLDLLSTNFDKKKNLNLFTMDRYNSIVKYKTAYYGFLLPVKIAMYLAGMRDPEMHRQAKTILLEMGHFYQVQDDYLDCYGDLTITGKNSTDIQEGKCTWLIVVALQRANPEQRKILEECYGFEDMEKVKRVKNVYDDLGLLNTYSIYEEETYNLLTTHIQQMSRGLPHDLFLNLLEKIYRRIN